MAFYILIYIESLIILFVFISWLFSFGTKKLVDYQITQIAMADGDGNVLIQVNKLYTTKHQNLIITKALMGTGSYKLGGYISLPE